MAKLLIVDDDREILNMCQIWFDQKHSIDAADCFGDGAAHIDAGQFDLVILDLHLPDGTGRDLLRRIRGRGMSTPVLILTGADDINDKVDLLELGADDYLTKPFHFRELEARVKAILRRPAAATGDCLECDGLILFLEKPVMVLNGNEIELTPKEHALLSFFMRHPGQTFSQDALIARVWPNSSETSPDVVRIYVQRLRRKLSVEADHEFIKNLRGHGYIFRGSVHPET